MIRNCGECPHLVGLVQLGIPIYGCGKTKKKLVVPQQTDRKRAHPGRTVTVFPRVPKEICPLPDSEADKKEPPAQ